MAEIYAQLSKKFCLKSAHEIGFLLGGIFHLLMKISFRQGDKLCQTLAEISSELALMKLTPKKWTCQNKGKNNFAFGTFFSLQCMSGVAETMQVTKAVGHWFDSRKGVFEVRGHRKTRFNILDPKFWQIH